MTKKLLVRPNPFLGESLFGYIVRLALCNGYENPTEFLSLLPDSNAYISRKTVRVAQLYNPPLDLINRLAALAQKDPQILYNLTTFPFGKKRLDSISASRRDNIIYLNLYKFCALCLKEENYHRKIWDLIIVTACPIHNCLLRYTCPQCKKPLKISQGFIYKCLCGFDFRETEPVFISENEVELTKYVYMLAGLLKIENKLIPPTNPLINYSLKDFCSIIFYYTKRVFRLYSEEKRFHFSKIIERESLHQLVYEAFSIFNNFPENYLAYLEKLVQNSNYKKNRNWFNYFAANYNDFYSSIPNSLTSLLYKTFDKHIDDILFRNNTKISQANFPTSITAFELADQLGLKAEEVIKLSLNGDFDSRKYSELLPIKAYLFDGDAFYKVMSKIRSNKKDSLKHKTTNVVNLTEISDYLSNHKIRLHEFLSLILKGKIKYCSEDYNQHGLNRFLFPKNDLEKFVGS
jgi:hypothetical protein